MRLWLDNNFRETVSSPILASIFSEGRHHLHHERTLHSCFFVAFFGKSISARGRLIGRLDKKMTLYQNVPLDVLIERVMLDLHSEAFIRKHTPLSHVFLRRGQTLVVWSLLTANWYGVRLGRSLLSFPLLSEVGVKWTWENVQRSPFGRHSHLFSALLFFPDLLQNCCFGGKRGRGSFLVLFVKFIAVSALGKGTW